MTTPKEPCFFSDDQAWSRGLGWYESLFAAAPVGALRGEASTHYTKLPDHPRTVERIVQVLEAAAPGGTRFVYLMRHPVDRLISQYMHEWTQRIIREPLESAVESHPALIDYGRYAMQLAPYLAAFGRERLLPVFFERLTAQPSDTLSRIARFIGLHSDAAWDEAVAPRNVSAERLRASPLRDALVHAPVATLIRRRLIPKSWRDRARRLWTMPERPALSPAVRARVEAVFDEDLARLGSWLGLPLSCATFKARAASRAPGWSPEAANGAEP
jgi:hypothetical protein